MKLYLDDDCASRLLARLLRQAGHQVELPIEADLQPSGSREGEEVDVDPEELWRRRHGRCYPLLE